MNRARTSAEWSYGEVKRLFSTQYYIGKMKVQDLLLGTTYICCILPFNMKACFGHRSGANLYF